MGGGPVRRLEDHLSEKRVDTLLEHIKDSELKLDNRGSEISLTLLGLAKTHREERAQEYINDFLEYCEDAGMPNGKDLLMFYSEVADWYFQTKHDKIHGSYPDDPAPTRDLVGRLTNYNRA